MPSNNRFLSARKLDSLEVGTKITFAAYPSVYAEKWVKVESGKWRKIGDTFSKLHPYDSQSLIDLKSRSGFTVTD